MGEARRCPWCSAVNKAVIYYTDNALLDPLATRCRELLIPAIGDAELISVSQKPLDFGKNICVGDIGRSHLSLYRQMYAGLEATDAEVVYMAEHDCLYTSEHFKWTPPEDGVFYYNLNAWFVNWKSDHKRKGRYSSPWGIRHATSQLVCNRQLLMDNVRERIERLQEGWKIHRGIRGACEPGVAEVQDKAWVRMHNDGIVFPAASRWKRKWKSTTFQNVLPNLDVRHNQNLTGWRRGHQHTMNLAPWGDFAELMNG